ncbi:MAG TPA: class I SAM-dependent methyltransferase [Kineosporiaceae bacterium]|nr:class I SAM-dependent methyltransferase [Kineosporiaceae bacterium]
MPAPTRASSSSSGARPDLAGNRALWAAVNSAFTDRDSARAWAATEVTWGLFRVPERELGVLGDVRGLDVVELGCGTAYFSAWLARLGARPVAVDVTHAQLRTAARRQRQQGPVFPLVEADAEQVPLRDASFDLVVSEYGASVWCDPERWVAEASRLLRPDGRLVFLTNSVLVTLCVPADEGYATEQLVRPQRGLHRVRWPGGGTEFHPGHGDWIRILSANGFVVEALHELYAAPGSTTPEYYDIATAEWAARWPVEDLWAARRDPAVEPAGRRDGTADDLPTRGP